MKYGQIKLAKSWVTKSMGKTCKKPNINSFLIS